MVFKEDDISIHSELSVNGRLFILPRTHSQRTVVSGCVYVRGRKGGRRERERERGGKGVGGRRIEREGKGEGGRDYIVCSVPQPPLQDQSQRPTSSFPEDSSREIAAHLTLYDWNLFTNTQQMELVYRVFGRHKFGKIVTNLDLLLRRFTEVRVPLVM